MIKVTVMGVEFDVLEGESIVIGQNDKTDLPMFTETDDGEQRIMVSFIQRRNGKVYAHCCDANDGNPLLKALKDTAEYMRSIE